MNKEEYLKDSIKKVMSRKNIYLEEIVNDIDEEGFPYKKINHIKIVKGGSFKGDVDMIMVEDMWGKINTTLMDACCDIDSPLEHMLIEKFNFNFEVDEDIEKLVYIREEYKELYESKEVQNYIRSLIES